MHLYIHIMLGYVLLFASADDYIDCSVNTTLPAPASQSQLWSANGGCPKRCIRQQGVCVPENCLGHWPMWHRQPVTISCYYRWLLLIISGCILSFMFGLICYSLVYELQRCIRKWRMWQYSYFSNGSIEYSNA